MCRLNRKMLRAALVLACALVCAVPAGAQSIRITNRRDIDIPDYATFRLGPFYSTATFSQSVGARWTRGRGRGTDFLTGTSRGVILDDGWDVPLVSRLQLQNYLILSRNMDMDISVSAQYEYFPLDTQRDQWVFGLAEEGISAFLSSEFRLSRNVEGQIYWSPSYRTDFVDFRGNSDVLAGREFEYFRNEVGAELNWLLAENKTLTVDGSRVDLIPDETEFADQEFVSHRIGTGYGVEVLPGVEVGGRLGYSETDYKLESRQDNEITDASLYVNFDVSEDRHLQLSRNASVYGSVGYARGETKSAGDAEGSSSEGVIWSAGIDWGEQGRLSRNMTHGLGYTRAFSGTFDSDLAIIDTWTYDWAWIVGLWDLGFASVYSDTDPQDRANGYTDWLNRFTADYHLTRELALQAYTSYRIRENETTGDEDPLADDFIDRTSDYEEWISQIGTSYQLTRQIDFSTYFQHAERYQDADAFDFTRDTFQALMTYSHKF